MLGITHKHIYCKVTECKFNVKHETYEGKTRKLLETYYTCRKEEININKKGKCTEA